MPQKESQLPPQPPPLFPLQPSAILAASRDALDKLAASMSSSSGVVAAPDTATVASAGSIERPVGWWSTCMGLPVGSVRGRFPELKRRICALEEEFDRNLSEGGQGQGQELIWLTREELDGVPEVGASVLRSARRGETRRRVKLAAENRCSQNIPLFKEILLLRHEAARLLGYPNHAALRMEERMAKSPGMANAFLAEVRSRLMLAGKAEVGRLRQAKKEDLKARGQTVEGEVPFISWDYAYYDGLLWEQSKPDGAKKLLISEYFALGHTVTAMLGIFEHLFGLRNVSLFAVWDVDAGDAFLGYSILISTSERASTGIHGIPTSYRQGFFTRPDGTRQYPATALICNLPEPKPDKPSLLGHMLVVLRFHELRHAIYDLASKTTYARFHGPAGTVIDFGEAPSQVLENWCFIPEQLKALSRHYSYLSPEYLGPESSETIEKTDYAKLWTDLQSSGCCFDDLAVLGQGDGGGGIGADTYGHGYANFRHIVTGDYDAGYHSYLL
ncbi:hypothetical protein VTK26DRAFT_2808 [Humicola hyalothermophila]